MKTENSLRDVSFLCFTLKALKLMIRSFVHAVFNCRSWVGVFKFTEHNIKYRALHYFFFDEEGENPTQKSKLFLVKGYGKSVMKE